MTLACQGDLCLRDPCLVGRTSSPTKRIRYPLRTIVNEYALVSHDVVRVNVRHSEVVDGGRDDDIAGRDRTTRPPTKCITSGYELHEVRRCSECCTMQPWPCRVGVAAWHSLSWIGDCSDPVAGRARVPAPGISCRFTPGTFEPTTLRGRIRSPATGRRSSPDHSLDNPLARALFGDQRGPPRSIGKGL